MKQAPGMCMYASHAAISWSPPLGPLHRLSQCPLRMGSLEPLTGEQPLMQNVPLPPTMSGIVRNMRQWRDTIHSHGLHHTRSLTNQPAPNMGLHNRIPQVRAMRLLLMQVVGSLFLRLAPPLSSLQRV